jgi:hypothetical protein
VALAGCTPEQPDFVYVPAESYTISVRISMPGEARAGEWIPLSAERRSGPWKRVRRSDAPPGIVPFGKPPPEFEKEVAANLHWMTEPGGAQFDVPLTPTNERKVKFDKPGTYQVWARNAYPTDAKSNVVAVTVK